MTDQRTISPEYRELLRHAHEADEHWGTSAAKYADDVASLAHGGFDVLDYGCGKGALLKALKERGIAARGYDPGIPELSAPPKPAGIVACVDVLEHVEPGALDAVLAHICSLAPVAYLSIALFLSRKVLPDGRNAHLIVKPAAWWMEKLQGVFARLVTWHLDKHWLVVVAYRETGQ